MLVWRWWGVTDEPFRSEITSRLRRLMGRSRTDANQKAIVDALQRTGWKIVSLTNVGGGCPDLLACRGDGVVELFEIKTATGRLRDSQSQFLAKGWPVTILRSVDDVEALLKRRRSP